MKVMYCQGRIEPLKAARGHATPDHKMLIVTKNRTAYVYFYVCVYVWTLGLSFVLLVQWAKFSNDQHFTVYLGPMGVACPHHLRQLDTPLVLCCMGGFWWKSQNLFRTDFEQFVQLRFIMQRSILHHRPSLWIIFYCDLLSNTLVQGM